MTMHLDTYGWLGFIFLYDANMHLITIYYCILIRL